MTPTEIDSRPASGFLRLFKSAGDSSMALSEETMAIVAAQLAAAHCAAAPSFTTSVSHKDVSQYVTGLYENYLMFQKIDDLEHFNPVPIKGQKPEQ
jgi:hypothetical protein